MRVALSGLSVVRHGGVISQELTFSSVLCLIPEKATILLKVQTFRESRVCGRRWNRAICAPSDTSHLRGSL